MLGVWLVGSENMVYVIKVNVGKKLKIKIVKFKVRILFGGFMVCYVIDDIYYVIV